MRQVGIWKVSLMTCAALLFLATGCCTIKRPLCPRLANQSYTPPLPPDIRLNHDMDAELKARDIRVSVLSPFVAEFSGNIHEIHWLKQNYPQMLCGFNPIGIAEREIEYTTCMKYADSWASIVNSSQPGNLMLDNSHYPGVCTQ